MVRRESIGQASRFSVIQCGAELRSQLLYELLIGDSVSKNLEHLYSGGLKLRAASTSSFTFSEGTRGAIEHAVLRI